jgi:hypothetical protein
LKIVGFLFGLVEITQTCLISDDGTVRVMHQVVAAMFDRVYFDWTAAIVDGGRSSVKVIKINIVGQINIVGPGCAAAVRTRASLGEDLSVTAELGLHVVRFESTVRLVLVVVILVVVSSPRVV